MGAARIRGVLALGLLLAAAGAAGAGAASEPPACEFSQPGGACLACLPPFTTRVHFHGTKKSNDARFLHYLQS